MAGHSHAANVMYKKAAVDRKRAVLFSKVARLIIVAAQVDDMTGEVEIGVQDSGTGIPGTIVDQVFEPLFTTKPEGMGMGLALSRTIIEAHGGRLWADRLSSQPGAVFRFTLRPA